MTALCLSGHRFSCTGYTHGRSVRQAPATTRDARSGGLPAGRKVSSRGSQAADRGGTRRKDLFRFGALTVDAGWARVAEAAESDAVVVAEVVAVEPDEVRVEVGGVSGLLRLQPGQRQPRVGDRLPARVIALNVKRRVLEVIRR